MNNTAIICIDDETTILTSLKAELIPVLGNDYLIELAESGEDGIALCEELLSEGWHIPLVIVDYIMPGLKGDEVLARLHQLMPATLKIMLTGQVSIEGITNAVNQARLYGYIAKPWESQHLKLTVQAALMHYQQEQSIQQLHQQQNELIKQLRGNEQRLQQFLEAIPVGIGIFDQHEQLLFYNKKAKELFNDELSEKTALSTLYQLYQPYQKETQQPYPYEQLSIKRALKGAAVAIDNIVIDIQQ
jgi:response regulator RpfG family c-di-GMP phosphodiesterase